MKRIIIFEDSPSSDGCGCFLGVVVLLLLLVGDIAIWPIMISAAGDDMKYFLMVSGVVIVSCIVTTIIYYFANKEHMAQKSFFSVFGVIYAFTAIVAGIMLHLAFSLTDDTYGTFDSIMTIIMTAVMVTIAPSAIAAAVCKLLKIK